MNKRICWMLVLSAVSAVMFAGCAGTDSSKSSTTGTGTIVATGGNGSASGGGNGRWYMETHSPKGVVISKIGAAIVNFTVPTNNPLVNLGNNAVTISANTIVTVLAAGTGSDAGAGVLYLVTGSDKLYLGTGLTSTTLPISAQEVTGLSLVSGATLTLGLNIDTDLAGGMDTAQVTFTNDVDIAGTLRAETLNTSVTGTLDGTALDTGGLVLSANGVFIRSTGWVNTRGLDGTALGGQRGGNGGHLLITANNYLSNEGVIDNSGGNSNDTSSTSRVNGGSAGRATSGPHGLVLMSSGAIINRGYLLANGGNGATGGDSCDVLLHAEDSVYNSGGITANGGTGYNGLGGNYGGASKLALFSEHASVYNSYELYVVGGDGTLGGGNGGLVSLVSVSSNTYGVGDVLNSGSIVSNGGNAWTVGRGGTGGTINFYAHGAITNNASLYMNGGYGTGLGLAPSRSKMPSGLSNSGGNGGMLLIEAAVPVNPGNGSNAVQLGVKPIQISGDIQLSGGASDGSNGGRGGYLQIIQDEAQSLASMNIAPYTTGVTLSDGGIFLLGYESAVLSAGSGIAFGGLATSFTEYHGDASLEIHAYPSPTGTFVTDSMGTVFEENTAAGPITNEIDIYIRGGDASDAAGKGGDGGSLEWGAYNTKNVPSSAGSTIVKNSGRLDVSGGAGGSSGGGPGQRLFIHGDDGVVNAGEVYVLGGNSSGGKGGAGAMGSVTLETNGALLNNSPISASGGSGNIGGAGSSSTTGGGIYLTAGGKVETPGSLNANGGAGNFVNGIGGTVVLWNATTFGDIDVRAGTGSGPLLPSGTITINGQPYQPVY